ncbi:MAG: HAD family hydrolase [Elusimicrobiota bacterium]
MKLRPKAVFIDRDGVLIRDAEYLGSVTGLSVIKGAPQALKLLRKAGFKIVIVTNQSGVARGYFTLADVRKIHAELKRRLAKAGARWDALYVSPHGPKSGHPWRKPGTGMLMAAKRKLGLDLKGSYLVGDKTSDIECARRAGCTGVLVRTGKGGRDKEYKAKPAIIRRDLLSAARWIAGKNFTNVKA